MTSLPRHIIIEMTAIILTATLLGVAWNGRLLHAVWTGQAVTTGGEQAAPAGVTPLPLGLRQVKELYDRHEAVFVDARDRTAFAAGHILGAASLPIGTADAEIGRIRERPPLSATIVVYCTGYDCHDSRALGEKLLRWGYRTVYVFEGGFPAWRDAGYPTEGKTP